MTDENKSSITNLMIISIISSVIGGLIVYYLLKPKISVASLQQLNISSLENRLNNIEQNLQQLQQIQLQPSNSPYQLPKNNMTLTA